MGGEDGLPAGTGHARYGKKERKKPGEGEKRAGKVQVVKQVSMCLAEPREAMQEFFC